MKRFIYRYILPYLGLILVKTLSATYRIKIINPEIEQSIINSGLRPVYVSWHQRFFAGITFLAKRKPIAIMVSQSKDGDFIARIIEIFGWKPVRGSSSKGGTKALKEIKALTGDGFSVGHIVDGPKGPFGIVKPGVVVIAYFSGMPVLPVIVSSDKKWIFKKSWDKFIIPKPFSRVTIKFGNPINIPPKIKTHEIEEYRVLIEDALKKEYKETDDIWSQFS